MPDTEVCEMCKGAGTINALKNSHDDEKERIECPNCHGAGVIHWMTDEEEQDYWENYW